MDAVHAPRFGKYWVGNCQYRCGVVLPRNLEPVQRFLWRVLYQE